MGLYSLTFTIGAVIALLLGLIPLLFTHVTEAPTPIILLSCFGSLACLCLSALLLRQRTLFIEVLRAAESIGVTDTSGGLTELISKFVTETTRYHRAAFASRLDQQAKQVNLSENLCLSVALAFREFDARAAELSLIDEESGQWSQAMMIGEPRTMDAQSMLSGDEKGPTRIVTDCERGVVVVKPVSFAGTVFGALRVELNDGVKLNQSDRKVIELLATQAGILLVDARFTDEVIRMRRIGEETTRAKTGFLANLSHEIRGPLGIILNGVELSLDGLCGEISEELSETLRMIRDSGNHLLDLVNDVLDYAKVEAGKITGTPVEIVLSHLLEDLTAVVRSQANQKGHQLSLESVDPTLGIFCDKRHARQILINFLTNAIKYTPDGGKIVVSAARTRENRVKLSVRDSGIGIPESERSKVFGAFERVDDKYAMTQVGAGLGMPLTRRLAEVNGGKVGFESEEGKGSTFWALLPGAVIEGVQDFSKEGDDGKVVAQGKGESVLLVDQESETRKMLERYLTEQGFVVINAASGTEVLKTLRERDIELAVVENDLPDLPGEDMVSAIRATPYARSVPIILLSSRAFVFDIERFLKLGVDRCLSKPFPLGELALTVRRLIDQNRKLEQDSAN